MEPYWQLLTPRLACLGLDPARVESHPALRGLHPGESVVLRERDPRLLLELFFAAQLRGVHVWLPSPDWQSNRLRTVADLAGPAAHVIGGGPLPEPTPGAVPAHLASFTGGQSAICVPTGGTSGRVRFAVHTWDTLAASAMGFLEFFAQEHHWALCCLPLYHVGGLMQAVRVLLSGGELILGSPHDPRSGLPRDFGPRGCFLSLVPSQLRRLLDAGAADWLRQFGLVLVGGAAVDAALLGRCRDERLPMSPSYGMTETAAVACALHPTEFLAGAGGVGHALPHVGVVVVPRGAGAADAAHPGRVVVHARSLCKALLPGGPVEAGTGLETFDLGYFDDAGSLRITGRSDHVIVCGGLKLDPAEIEGALIESGLVAEVTVMPRADPQWGEVAVACYVPKGPVIEEQLRAAVRSRLSPVHVPKAWIPLEALPRNMMGKLDREALAAIATVGA